MNDEACTVIVITLCICREMAGSGDEFFSPPDKEIL
jgi:hypothetical protein